jgi:hypothetical protein
MPDDLLQQATLVPGSSRQAKKNQTLNSSATAHSGGSQFRKLIVYGSVESEKEWQSSGFGY